MTALSEQCSCYGSYLLDPHTDPDTLLDNALGPKQPLFALIADLTLHRHIDLLQMLYAGESALHAALSDDVRFGPHQDFTRRSGAPFVPGELAPSHALRVLAGLGLVLAMAQEPPPEGPLRAAIGWYQEACGSLPGRSGRWSPARLSGDNPHLRRRLELLAQVAGEGRDDGAVLTVAITLHRLVYPAGAAPARRRWLRSPQPAVGVLFDQGSAGAQASLTAGRLAGTPPGLVPDPERMFLFTADMNFQNALDRAWIQAGQGKIDGTVLWSAASREGPCPRIIGESAGAAFAVMLDETRRLQRRLSAFTVIRRLVEDTSIIGKIGDAGSLQSVEGYRNKLKVLPEHAKVVVPAVDAGKARTATARELQIVPARRWKDAAHAARRRSKLVIFRQALAVTAVLALAGGGFAGVQEHAAVVQRQIDLSVNLANQSNSTVGVNVRDADLYALAAWQARHTEPALSSLLSREADPYLGSFAEPAKFIVGTMAISPDGRLLAVGGAADPQDAAHSSSVQLWDIATRRLLAAFAVPNAVRAVAFSPDGSTLTATPATRSGNLQMWSVATHRELPDPVAETGVITSIAYDPDGRLLAVGEVIPPRPRNGQPPDLAKVPAVIDLWDLATHRLVRRLGGLAGPVWSLDFSDDGRLLASGGYDHTARLWDPATGQERAVLTGTAAQVQAVKFEPGGARILASSGADSKIRVWSAVTGAPDLGITTSGGAAGAFAFSPGEPYLYAGLDFNDVFRVDLFTGNIAGDPIRLQQPVTHFAVSPDGRTLVLGGPQGSLVALDIEGRTFYNLDQSPLTAAAVNRSGQLAATGAADGNVHVWPVSDPAATAILRNGQDVVSAAFSPDASLLAVGGADCHVTTWDFSGARHLVDINNAKRVADLAAPGTSGNPRIVDLAFSRDGKTLATYCVDNASVGSAVAMLWDTRTFKRLATYRPPGALSAGSMAFSPDGRAIALDTGTGSVLIWDTRLRRVTGRISVGTGTHFALAFSPDGRLLAVTVADTVQLWNVSSHVRVATTTVNTSQFHELAFSPDGSTLAGTSQDTTVRIWQVPSLQLIAALSPPTPPLATGTTPVAYNGLAYSPDGRTLVTASSDSTAQVWDLNPGDEVHNLCDALRGPQLTGQWRQLPSSPGPDPCPSR